MTPIENFGQYLRKARTAYGISARQLGKISNTSQGAISDIERGRRLPGEKMLTKLSRALELDFAEIHARTGRIPSDISDYLQLHPTAGTLLQRLVKYNFSDRSLVFIINQIDKLYSIAKNRKQKKQQNVAKAQQSPVVSNAVIEEDEDIEDDEFSESNESDDSEDDSDEEDEFSQSDPIHN